MAETRASNQKPYLLRAMHEWMVDNALTPHIVIDASADGLRVPDGHVRDGKIVLNVSWAATRDLSLGNDLVCFEARFNGIPQEVGVPIDAVLGIYARETGQGMVFSAEGPADPPTNPPGDRDARAQRPTLKVVK